MELKKILTGIEGLKAKGNLELEIPKITSDSREVKTGDLFVAIKGFDVDGVKFIPAAVEAGAKAILVNEESKKDKRKNQQQRQEPEIKQEQPKIIPMEQPPKEVEPPDDFGIVMEPEEPEPIELPDPNENNRNIFDEIFNSDSDNWDDSNI